MADGNKILRGYIWCPIIVAYKELLLETSLIACIILFLITQGKNNDIQQRNLFLM